MLFSLRARFAEKRRFRGNTLLEYALIGSLLLTGTIPFLLSIGQDFQGHLANMRNDMRQKILVAQQAQITMPETIAPGQTEHQQTYFPGSQTCFANRWCLGVDAVESSTGNTATTGANGSQGIIRDQASFLEDIAAQAANDPNADPALVDILTQLANAGHGVGSNLENTLNNYNTGSFGDAYNTYWQSTVPFIGKTADLASYLAANPGALPPEVQSIVNGAVDRINSNMGKFIGAEGPSMDQWAAEVGNAGTAGDIHDDSNTVCSNGGDTQSCVQ